VTGGTNGNITTDQSISYFCMWRYSQLQLNVAGHITQDGHQLRSYGLQFGCYRSYNDCDYYARWFITEN